MNALVRRRPSVRDKLRGQPALRARAYIRECVEAGIMRRALLLRISQLPAGMARPHHLRLARVALDPLTVADRAKLFSFANGDMLVIWRGDAAMALATVTAELSYLFAGLGIEQSVLIMPLALPDQAELLSDLIAATLEPEDEPAPPPLVVPMNTSSLAALETCLAQADVTRFARRKIVCGRDGGHAFSMLWEKRFLSVREIMGTLLPGQTAQADPWLFRRLTRSLDRRMLALLALPDELRAARPFSINLNVGSLLSPDFLRFDSVLPPRLRGHVVLDLHPADVISDLSAFMFARDFAHARGYRLLLRGLTPELLRVFSPGRVGIDLVQLRWEPAFAELRLAAMATDPERVVLARAGTTEALAWAEREGIRLFQRPPSAVEITD